MKSISTFLFLLIISFYSFGQFQKVSVKIIDDLPKHQPTDHLLNKKSTTKPTTCTGDTLQYGRYKASTLQGLNVSKGYAIGQYYDAPGNVTVSGFDFYAWQSSRTKDSVTIVCRLYEAGKDTIPTGNPIRQTTIRVDSTFGTGQLSTLIKRINFAPYTTNKPFIITIECDDTINRVAVVMSNWTAGDGDQEWLGCGTVAGVWYNFKNLNVGGVALDCDAMLEPYVSYSHYADYNYKNCYNYLDSVKFVNTSSKFTFNRMYNRYSYYNLDYICQRWNYGNNFSYYSVINGGTKYPSVQNVDVTLISSIYGYSNGGRCDDTAVYRINYQPAQVTTVGNTILCSGDSLVVTALGNAPMHWFRKSSDTTAFQIMPRYASPALTTNDTVYVRSMNGICISTNNKVIGEVKTTPDEPAVQDDNICLNSSANLIATSNIGVINWFTDSLSTKPFFTGYIYETSILTTDTILFVQAQNFNCTSQGKVKIMANVSADFAPQNPITISDTTLCLLGGNIDIKATPANGDTIRWYNIPSGGKPLSTDETYTFSPQKEGQSKLYVEAFDGRCASSRLNINLNVKHFPKISLEPLNEICEGDTATLTVSSLNGNINWYSNKTDLLPIFTGPEFSNDLTTKSNTFYVEPFAGACIDTQRYAIVLVVNPYGKITTKNTVSTCRNTNLSLTGTTSFGTLTWYDNIDLNNVLANGNTLNLFNVDADNNYWVTSNNKGCISNPQKITIKTIANTDATFDFQILGWRNVQFLARKGAQGAYKWDFEDAGNTKQGENITYIFTKDGNYNVRLIVENGSGCHDTAFRLISLTTVGTNDVSLSTISTFPNPFNNEISVALSDKIKHATFHIIDINGRIVEQKTISSSNGLFSLNTESLAYGTYFLRVTQGDNIVTKKIIKIATH